MINNNIKICLNRVLTVIIDCEQTTQENKIYRSVYRDILDRYAVNLITNAFNSESVLKAIMKLSVMERVIIAFHFILTFSLNEISEIIQTSPESVYSQKSKALKKMRVWLSAA